MKKIFGYAAFLVTFLVASALVKEFMGEYRFLQSFNSNRNSILNELEAINQKTPYALDDFTTLEGVHLEDKTIIYKAKSNWNTDYFTSSAFQKYQLMTNIIFACGNPVLNPVFAAGYNLRYEYYHVDGNLKMINPVRKSDCEPIWSSNKNEFADFYVSTIKSSLPLIVDNDTHWINLRRQDDIIELEFKFVNYTNAQLDYAAFDKAERENYQQKCNPPDFNILMKKGFKIKTTYFDRSFAEFHSFTVDAQMCGFS